MGGGVGLKRRDVPAHRDEQVPKDFGGCGPTSVASCVFGGFTTPHIKYRVRITRAVAMAGLRRWFSPANLTQKGHI